MWTRILIALFIASVLAGCVNAPVVPSKTPSVPYWQNRKWINALVVTINNNLVYPVEATAAGFPYGQATVQFAYDNGRLKHVHIVKSTGNQILDSAIITQITDTKPPVARGLDTTTSRLFQVPITFSISNSQFYRSIYDAIMSGHTYYPRSAVLHGQQGLVEVRFEYRNGYVLNQTIVHAIGSTIFEEAALKKISSAKMPPPPAWARDKTLAFKISICFTLGKRLCPGKNIEIHYVSSDTQVLTANTACAEVGFSYKAGKIVNPHIVSSSGDADLDKTALQTISNGNFPQPSSSVKNHASSFEIPVCLSNKAQNQPTAKAPL